MIPERAAAIMDTNRTILVTYRPIASFTLNTSVNLDTKGGAMRYALVIIGIIMIAIGGIWILQGTNILPGSFMTGQQMWAIIGAIVLVVGIIGLIAGARMIARYRPI